MNANRHHANRPNRITATDHARARHYAAKRAAAKRNAAIWHAIGMITLVTVSVVIAAGLFHSFGH